MVMRSEHRGEKRKALLFCPWKPYPPHSGARQVFLATIQALKTLGYQVTLFSSTLSATGDPWSPRTVAELQEELGVHVHIHQATLADLLFMYQGETTDRIADWDRDTPPGLREDFRNVFTCLAPELVVVNYPRWGKLAIGDAFSSTARIILSHDLLTVNELMLEAVKPYLEGLDDLTWWGNLSRVDRRVVDEDFFAHLQTDARHANAEEYRIYDQYDATATLSPHDAETIRRYTSRTRVCYVPITFPVQPLPNTYTGAPLFVISQYPLNVQGYLYFAIRVLPLILRQLPDFELQVVGKGCRDVVWVEGIRLLDFVPDLKPLYAEARFAVCPLIGGTGMQVKILEAMAHGVPVIALRNIARSSPIQHGVNGLVAENAAEFAEYVVQLWRDPALCRRLGQAARETIAEQFSPEVGVEKWAAAITAARANRTVPSTARAPATAPGPPTVDSSMMAVGRQRSAVGGWLSASDAAVPGPVFRRSEHPRISVITPAYNCAHCIRDCIESVLAQGYDNFEHIIVDGASTDGTVEILAEYPHLRWISEPDSGVAEALNKGLRMARGDIIGWLSANDTYVQGAFARIVREVNPHQGRHVVYGKTLLLDRDGLSVDWVVPGPVTLARLIRWFAISLSPPAVFYARELLQDVGFFNEELRHAVDYEYWLRIAAQGYAFHFIDQVLARWTPPRSAEGASELEQELWRICLPYYRQYLSPHEQAHFWKEYYTFRMRHAQGERAAGIERPDPRDRAAVIGFLLALRDADRLSLATLRELAADYPDIPDLLGLLGQALYQDGRMDEAQQVFQRALALDAAAVAKERVPEGVGASDPSHPFRREDEDLDPTDEANRELLRQSLALDPANLHAHMRLAELARAQGRFEEAARHYLEALEYHPDSPPLWIAAGKLALEVGDRETARAAFQRALALEPFNSEVRQALDGLEGE